MAVTIEDIANKLGIAVSTVSKALNGYPGVAEKTRQRVLEAARELDYQPKAATTGGTRGRPTRHLGLVINYAFSAVAEYVGEMLDSAAYAAKLQDYHFVFYNSMGEQAETLQAICHNRSVDGVLLMWPDAIDDTVALLQAESMPFVSLAQRAEHPAVSYVVVDNRAGTLAVVQHLITCGHRRIGCFTNPELGINNQDRVAGYLDALEMAGIPVEPELMIETSILEEQSGARALNDLMNLPDPPTAVFAFHEMYAVEAIKAAQARGLRVPQDVAIAAMDGTAFGRFCTPSLTTAVEPFADMGRRAAEILLGLIDGSIKEPVKLTFPATLVVRESTQTDKFVNHQPEPSG
jgi:DNA-binding LacI/PurR family transcriptional regulator